MKKTHQKKTLDPRIVAAQSSVRDKRRMLMMAGALVVLVFGYLYSQSQATQYGEEEALGLPGIPEGQTEAVQLPSIDAAKLERLVSDKTDADRVLLERKAVDELFPIARNLTEAHFDVLEADELDEARIAELLATPSAFRGEAFIARGWVVSKQLRKPGGGRPNEVHGKLVLEDYSTVYFVVAEDSSFKKPIVETDYARLDGLFLKAYSDEDPDQPGQWVQGPLLLGPSLRHSYKSLGEVTQLPLDTFVDVKDDDVNGNRTGEPFHALWTTLAFARDSDRDDLDRQDLPELTNDVALEMLGNGSAWRGRGFRMPVLKVLDIWERKADENPARLETVTEGWLGSWTWSADAKVIRFSKPGGRNGVRRGDEVTGSGIFLKNIAYEPAKGGLRISSMVTLDSLEKFIRPVDRSMDQMWALVVGGTVLMVGLLVFLVTRDRKRAEELQQKLVARRRARRNQPRPIEPLGDAPSA